MENHSMTTTSDAAQAPAGPIESSPQINHLATALALAQAEIKGAAKESVNPHFNRAYADLASVWDACRSALTKNGLAVIQQPIGEGKRIGVRTQLVHSSGQWTASTIWATPERDGPQPLGSVITYLRRYSLAAVAGVAPEDDDGEAATARGGQGGGAKAAARPPQRPPAGPRPAPAAQSNGAAGPPAPASGNARATAEQLNEILRRMKGLGWSVPHQRNWLKKHADVELPSELTAGAATHVLGELEAAASAGQQGAGAGSP